MPFKEIPINEIDIPHPRDRGEEEFGQLVANIKKQGLIQPIRVRKEPSGRYTLIFGEGRLRAAKQLGWMLIPAQIVEGIDDQQVLLQWLTENLQRVNMSPKDKAINISRLIDEFGLSVKEVSDRLGMSESYVSKLHTVISDGSEELKQSLDRNMASVAGNIAYKFKKKNIQDEILHVFTKQKVKKQRHQQALVKTIDKNTENVRKSIEKIRSELKQYRNLLEIAYSRREALIPNLEKLKKDSVFMNKLKIYRISLKW
jgi:ParB family chromosome partitioning protein